MTANTLQLAHPFTMVFSGASAEELQNNIRDYVATLPKKRARVPNKKTEEKAADTHAPANDNQVAPAPAPAAPAPAAPAPAAPAAPAPAPAAPPAAPAPAPAAPPAAPAPAPAAPPAAPAPAPAPAPAAPPAAPAPAPAPAPAAPPAAPAPAPAPAPTAATAGDPNAAASGWTREHAIQAINDAVENRGVDMMSIINVLQKDYGCVAANQLPIEHVPSFYQAVSGMNAS
jgi:hypothetical protein